MMMFTCNAGFNGAVKLSLFCYCVSCDVIMIWQSTAASHACHVTVAYLTVMHAQTGLCLKDTAMYWRQSVHECDLYMHAASNFNAFAVQNFIQLYHINTCT